MGELVSRQEKSERTGDDEHDDEYDYEHDLTMYEKGYELAEE